MKYSKFVLFFVAISVFFLSNSTTYGEDIRIVSFPMGNAGANTGFIPATTNVPVTIGGRTFNNLPVVSSSTFVPGTVTGGPNGPVNLNNHAYVTQEWAQAFARAVGGTIQWQASTQGFYPHVNSSGQQLFVPMVNIPGIGPLNAALAADYVATAAANSISGGMSAERATAGAYQQWLAMASTEQEILRSGGCSAQFTSVNCGMTSGGTGTSGGTTNVTGSASTNISTQTNSSTAYANNLISVVNKMIQNYRNILNNINTNTANPSNNSVSNLNISVGVNTLNIRQSPNTQSGVMGQLRPGSNLVAMCYVEGENIGGISKWWKTSYSTTGTINIKYLTNAIVNQPYSYQLVMPVPKFVGPEFQITASVFDGMLPPGLSLNRKTGQISGTPTKAGYYGFVVTTWDPMTTSATVQGYYSLMVEGAGVATATQGSFNSLDGTSTQNGYVWAGGTNEQPSSTNSKLCQ